jgi:hypothetical protein
MTNMLKNSELERIMSAREGSLPRRTHYGEEYVDYSIHGLLESRPEGVDAQEFWRLLCCTELIKEGGYPYCATCASPVRIVPLPMLRRVCLRVYMWGLLHELQNPPHRRPHMAPLWVKAMQARYWVNTLDENGKPIGGVRGFYLKGNQREVIEAYDRIRREAGDFSVDELGGLN